MFVCHERMLVPHKRMLVCREGMFVGSKRMLAWVFLLAEMQVCTAFWYLLFTIIRQRSAIYTKGTINEKAAPFY